MDLSSASTYLNNLLAKAGLLKGGVDLPFHNPSSEDGSITRIINLVHDLVMRREKEEEQLENLANTIRQLRNDNAKLQQASDKLKDKYEDLERKNNALEGQQKAFNATLRTSESATKSLRDENSRLKMILQQVRSQFANDIRKRDVQLGKIKEQLLNPRRNPRNVNTITITGTVPPTATDAGPQNACGPECMAQDTADALMELSQTLANENDNLVSITRQTLSTINSLQGIKDDFHWPTEEESGDAFLSVCPQSYDALSEELQKSLTGLRDMINQPSYVAIEELQERDKTIHEKDKEILKLQARIDVVEEEWRKAIEMVKMWNDSMRGKLPSTASKPVEIQQERAVGGLEQILEEDEEEEEEITRLEVTNQQYADNWEDPINEEINVADVSLDEEQLQREASMILNEDEDEKTMEEAQEQEYPRNIQEMLKELDADAGIVNGYLSEGSEDNIGDEVEEEDQEVQQWVDGQTMEEELPDELLEELPEDRGKGSEQFGNNILLESPEKLLGPHIKIPDSTPPPSSPLKSPPTRPRRTPKTKKIRVLTENISPSPKKFCGTPSKRKPNPRKTPKKALAPVDPSPILSRINSLLPHPLLTDFSGAAVAEESPKKLSPKKKTTKHAHFESPAVLDTPEFSTPKRTRGDITPISQPQFRRLEEEEEVEQIPSTPRRTSRVSKKRILLDPSEQPVSTRLSKRLKTPAIKKRSGTKVTFEDDEDFSH